MATLVSTKTMAESLGDQTAAEPHQQARSSNNEKDYDISAPGKHNDSKRKKGQKKNGRTDGEKQDEEEAGFGDYFVSLRLPTELVSS
jgi:hypothetical protein